MTINKAAATLIVGWLFGIASGAQNLPNMGRVITPLAPAGARFEPFDPGLPGAAGYLAGQAVTTVVSPDRATLLILTSGFNLRTVSAGPQSGEPDKAASNEYVFVYDIRGALPLKKQVIQVPNTYGGIAFDPGGKSFFVAGGVDDNVHVYGWSGKEWAESVGSPVALGHNKGVGLDVKPEAAGLAVSADGEKVVVANYYNDSVSVLTKSAGTWAKTAELDLRPGKINPAKNKGVPGGEYPFWVVINSNSTAYVSSLRDREVDVLNVNAEPELITRVKVNGQPNVMKLTADGSRLYVAEDETDTVDVIDTRSNKVVQSIWAGAMPRMLAPDDTGYNTNALTLSPDEKTLYVSHGNTNDIAVVDLRAEPRVEGLIPTGWYPTSISTSGDGKYLYIVNYKSPTGPNVGNCKGLTDDESKNCRAANEYNLNLIKAGFQIVPTPQNGELRRLTAIVAQNNHYARSLSAEERQRMAFIRSHIKHVIFIIKENRTYDQILGDLPVGNGDPDLAEFGAKTTPNEHALAARFVDLDNFYDRSEVSMDGWPWTTSARAPDLVEKQTSVNYAGRGLSYDSEGTDRNVNISYPTLAERKAANPVTPDDDDVLPGTANAAAPDGPGHELNTGYLWNDALRAGLSLRNYGFFIDLTRYDLPKSAAGAAIPVLRMPVETKTQVAFATDQALRPLTDIYFRGFDNNLADYWRFKEWEREYDSKYANEGLPALELVRFMHDHTGNFDTALDGVNTPELQQADNDYAVGLLVEKISHSRYNKDSLIFVIEDDSQDGPDHVDSHRSIALVAGAYVKQGAVVSTEYNTVDFLRTIEEALGLRTMNLNDKLAVPMADVFTEKWQDWSYEAVPSPMLANTQLPIKRTLFGQSQAEKPTHGADYWAAVTKGFDFSAEDRIDFATYNRVLWKGLMGDKPYPDAAK